MLYHVHVNGSLAETKAATRNKSNFIEKFKNILFLVYEFLCQRTKENPNKFIWTEQTETASILSMVDISKHLELDEFTICIDKFSKFKLQNILSQVRSSWIISEDSLIVSY